MEYVTVKPNVKTSGTKMYGEITGSVVIPIKDSHKNEIGKFELTFSLNLTTEFNVNVSYKLKKKWGIPYGINYFDVGITQTDTFTFDFKVSIEVDYSSEEQPFVQNNESGKIHRRGCVHLNKITDLSKLDGLSAIEMKEKIDANASLECKHCRPSQSFDDHVLYINTSPQNKVIHKKGCVHAKEPNGSNWIVSYEKATYWIKQGYQCCEWCHPDNREEIEYESFMSSTLYCSDWQQIATDITQWAKDSGMTEHSQRGITIINFDIPIYYPVKATVEVDFIFSFKLEASITYKYQYQQTNTYGMRISGSGCDPYSTKSSSVLANNLTMMGKVNVKVGLLVDVNINIAGLSKWIRAGVTAEVGMYADLYGILEINPSEKYYAAYMEAGVYVDIEAYYKLFKWDDSINIYEDKFPIVKLGYERAYFAYETYHDKLEINGSYDIDQNDLLKVKYFDLKTMKTAQDELKLSEASKYQVVISFKEGKYCEIKNGCIVAKADAPANFTDTMIIVVKCNYSWTEYASGKSVFYLGEYEIELEFGDGVSHTIGEWVVENYRKPTCTEPGRYESVAYCADLGCGKEINRVEIIEDPLGHDYVNDVCTRCGKMDGYSSGLEFVSNGNGNCYVSGLGSCTDSYVSIPPVSSTGDKVVAIGDFAFVNEQSITGVSIPEGVESIGSFAFYSCTYLESVVISESVKSISSFAFAECPRLNTVYYKGTGSQWSNIIIMGSPISDVNRYFYSETAPTVKGNFWHYVDKMPVVWPEYNEADALNSLEFTLSSDGTYFILSGTNNLNSSSVIIPEEYRGVAVKEIGDYAFFECDSIVSIVIPASIVYVNDHAFLGCDRLESIEVDQANPNYKTIDGNLYSKDGKTLIQYAVGKSESEFSIPTSVTTIGNGAMSGAYSITKIYIHGGVTRIYVLL